MEYLYQDALSKNVTIEKRYNELIHSLKEFTRNSSIWDMNLPKKLLEKFLVDLHNRIKLNNEIQKIPSDINDNDWKFIYIFYQLVHDRQRYLMDDHISNIDELKEYNDWSTNRVGSFFVKNIKNFKLRCNEADSSLKEFDHLFTLPKQNISLPHIALIYAANDFQTYSMEAYENFEDKKFGQSLESCINDVLSSDAFSTTKSKDFLDEKIDHPEYLKPSPCFDTNQFPNCIDYCNWHHSYFEKGSKEYNIMLMKYALPERKIISPFRHSEKELAKMLFGNDAIGDFNQTFAPFPLILYCYQRSKGFVGDNIGIYARVCDKFFPTPSDHGICLTSNMDIKELINDDDNYAQLFEPDLQNSDNYVQGGTHGSRNILAFFTGDPTSAGKYSYQSKLRQRDPRVVKNSPGGQIEVKFHHSLNIPNLFEDDNYHSFSSSLTLEAGMEYVIDVKPQVVQTTKAF